MTAHARILLAEDDEISQAIVQQILATLDHVYLTIVSDGRQALLACMASKYDLLIIDRKMPLISGDRASVHKAGISVSGKATPEGRVKVKHLIRRIKVWPGEG